MYSELKVTFWTIFLCPCNRVERLPWVFYVDDTKLTFWILFVVWDDKWISIFSNFSRKKNPLDRFNILQTSQNWQFSKSLHPAHPHSAKLNSSFCLRGVRPRVCFPISTQFIPMNINWFFLYHSRFYVLHIHAHMYIFNFVFCVVVIRHVHNTLAPHRHLFPCCMRV